MSLLTLLILIVLLLIAIKLLLWFVSYRDRVSKWKAFPGSAGLPFIGHALEFKSCTDILPNGLKYMKQHGLTFRVQLGQTRTLFTGDPRLNELITTSNTLLKKSLGVTFMKNWLGDGLISSDVDTWRVHRRLITPTFHFKILEDFVPIINKNAQHLVEYFRERRMESEFDVYEDVLLCSLDTVCETAMGWSINALRDGKQSNYVQCIKYMGRMLMMRSFSFWKQYDFLYNLSPERRTELKMYSYMRSITDKVIKTKLAEFRDPLKTKQEWERGGEDDLGMKKRTAFLDHLLSALDQNGGFMSAKELREEVDTFIFAGHDPVASTIAFTIYYLAKHQDIQQRVYEELLQVYATENELSFDKLADLRYLDAVLKESLRLCPTVPLHSRVMTEDVHFDGKVIPKGIHVVLFLYGAHRNEKLFTNPEKFDPDRFLDEDFAKKSLFGYLPFNAGPRNCIGQKFAMTVMKCIMGVLLKEFKFTARDDFVMQPVAEGVMKSQNGVMVRIEDR